jgi:hypothetical protein
VIREIKSRELHKADAVRIVIAAPQNEQEEIRKQISRAIVKLKRGGYLKDGYVITQVFME